MWRRTPIVTKNVNPQSKELAKRKCYIDALRIIAVILVLFNHTPGYWLYFDGVGLKYYVYSCISAISTANVPLFFMVSGVLLLGKEESICHLFRRRVTRIILVIVVFSIPIYLSKNTDPSIGEALEQLLSGTVLVPYWYLYAYLGMLLLLPYLRIVARHFTKNLFLYICVLYAFMKDGFPVVSLIARIVFNLNLSLNLDLPIVTMRQLFYPLAGYYLGIVLPSERLKPALIKISVASALVGVMLAGVVTCLQGAWEGYSQDYIAMFDWLVSFSIFITFRYIFEVKKVAQAHPSLANVLCRIGSLTFGVYLLDEPLRTLCFDGFSNLFEIHLPTLIVSFLWVAFSLLALLGLSRLLKQVPVLKELL